MGFLHSTWTPVVESSYIEHYLVDYEVQESSLDSLRNVIY